tara:strand:+ start:1972 stop:2121 length:150 start_codon:yes stop_codon:yes gene_type:complete
MDYAVGFIIGFICKEIYNILKYLSTSETIILDNDWDEEWDWISRPEDLP